MKKNEKKLETNPREDASCLSIIFYKWLLEIFRNGYERALDKTDLYLPLNEHASQDLGKRIFDFWDEERDRCKTLSVKSSPSLFVALKRCFGREIVFSSVILGILQLGIRTVQPIIIFNLLRCFETNDDATTTLYWTTGLVVTIFANCLTRHPINQTMTLIDVKILVACRSLVYRKILRVPSSKYDCDRMIKYLSNEETNNVGLALNRIWMIPLQACFIAYFSYRYAGTVVVGGFVFFFIFAPLVVNYGTLMSRLTLKMTGRKDERLKLLIKIIEGIRHVKMHALELPLTKLVNDVREKEIEITKRIIQLSETFSSLELSTPRFSLFVTVLLYVFLTNDVDAPIVYTVAAYYDLLSVIIYRELPKSLESLSKAWTTMREIENFLLHEEVPAKYSENDPSANWRLSDEVVSLRNVSAVNSLDNVTIGIKARTRVAIIGNNKSDLLLAALNEIAINDGKASIIGSVSYASRVPWMIEGSVRDNILYGRPMIIERYARVLTACRLGGDIIRLSDGDETKIGDKSTTTRRLSDDEIRRIGLARSLYRDADVYLLDETFSRLDESSSDRAMFYDCLKKFLRDKTVLFTARRSHDCFRDVDRIVVIEDGVVLADGTYDECRTVMKSADDDDDVDVVMPIYETPKRNFQPFNEEDQERLENRRFGSITAKTYERYFEATDNFVIVVLGIGIAAIGQLLGVGADFFVAWWIDHENEEARRTINSNDDNDPFDWYACVAGLLNIAIVASTTIRTLCFGEICARISKNLHARVFKGVCTTNVNFFASVPNHRIMSRFSSDTEVLDIHVPPTMTEVLGIAVRSIVFIIVVVAIVDPWLVIPALAYCAGCYYARRYYAKTNKSLKRLEKTTRSSLTDHAISSVQGLTTIRAFRAQHYSIREFDARQDLHSSAWLLLASGSRALGLYVELFGAILTTIVIFTLVTTEKRYTTTVGLVVNQCLIMLALMQRGIRESAELESHMLSVERLLDYSKLPAESLADEIQPMKKTTYRGEARVVFDRVSLVYDRQDKPSLKNLSLEIEPGETVSICGPGAPSVVDALYRLACFEGTISVDGVPTGDIDLRSLRSRIIGIVDREPVLFFTTLRANLDPHGKHADDVLWNALDSVELRAAVGCDLPRLDERLTNEGTKLSIGQRQLLGLAREIVRGCELFVLEETAIVDSPTDQLMRRTIERMFGNRAVIIVARRLGTIVESDRVLVLDADGEIAEFDKPRDLLQREDSVFYKLTEQSDASRAKTILKKVKSNYLRESPRL